MTWNLFCDHSKRREDWERSIFVRLKEGGYRLRENILFHLYVSTSPCGDARLNSPYEITTDCKEKISPLLFLLCASFVFFFSLRSVLLALFLCWQKVFHLRAKTPQALESVCVCVCATGAWSRVLGEGVQGKSELGKGAPHSWGSVALLGNTSLKACISCLLHTTLKVNECFGKHPHDQRDP